MAATQQAVVEVAEEHGGSHFDMHIREGLIDARHKKAMGPALWLYLYLHKRAAWKTGLVGHYTHAAAAAELGVCERTVGRHMERLRRGGYVITCAQRQHDMQVGITRYKAPSEPLSALPKLSTLEPPESPSGSPKLSTLIFPDEAPKAPQGRQFGASGWTHVATVSYSHDSTHRDDTAAAQQATAAAPPSPGKDEPGHAAGVSPASIAAAVLRAQGRPVSGPGVRRLVRASKEEVSDAYRGRVSDAQIVACLAYMRTKPLFHDQPHLLTPRRLAEDLGPWLLAGCPARYAPPVPTIRPRRPHPDDQHAVVSPRRGRQCECHAFLDQGAQHTLHCVLWGPATGDNYVDAKAKEVVYSQPRYVREQYREHFLLPEDRAQAGLS